MEEDHREMFRHVCKFCHKRFPCGRSLGGHIRSHMITINNTNGNSSTVTGTAGHGLRENPKKSMRVSDNDDDRSSEDETTSFQLIHSSSVLESATDNTQSDNETDTPARRRRRRRRRRSETGTRLDSNYKNNDNNCNYDHGSSSVFSEIEKEQEEVAMCLIMLSRDTNGFSESSDNNSFKNSASNNNGDEILENNKFKIKNSESSGTLANSSKRRRQPEARLSVDGFVKIRPGSLEISETGVSQSDVGKDFDRRSRFDCVTCKKSFNSYQALGGHRASHKKSKDGLCCGSKFGSKSEHCNNNSNGFDENKKKLHECPICLKVFQSGQALGGHKRSHLVVAVSEVDNSGIIMGANVVTDEKLQPVRNIRGLFDLNMPAPVEEEVKSRPRFDQWWVSSSCERESLVGLISNLDS